jgi:peptidyl-prolyl cis-trans isomerase SurA
VGMDATTPFRGLLLICGLTLLGGCKLTTEESRGRALARENELVQHPEANQRQVDESPTGRREIDAERERIGRQQPKARPQMPGEPEGPLAPLAPDMPLPAPIVGQPLAPTAPPEASPTVQASLTTLNVIKSGPAGDPRIKVIAHIGEKGIVTNEEVWEASRQRMQEYTSFVDGPGGKQLLEDADKKKAVYAEEFRRIIERELILDEMYAKLKKANKQLVIEEIKEFAGKAADRQLREFKKRYRAATDDDFRIILLGQGLTIPVIRRQIERQLMAEEYVRSMLREKNKGISLGEIREYFDSHTDDYKSPDRVKWLSIFISYNKFNTQREAYDYALAIQQHAAAGEDFAGLSKTYDHGLAGQAGGVGIGSARGEIQPVDVEPTVWALQPGQVSNLIETPAGYHIVKVVERDYAGVKPFDDKVQQDVRRRIQRDLQDIEYKRLVENLWRSGVVQVVEMPK